MINTFTNPVAAAAFGAVQTRHELTELAKLAYGSKNETEAARLLRFVYPDRVGMLDCDLITWWEELETSP
jgi:hypothetical protein